MGIAKDVAIFSLLHNQLRRQQLSLEAIIRLNRKLQIQNTIKKFQIGTCLKADWHDHVEKTPFLLKNIFRCVMSPGRPPSSIPPYRPPPLSALVRTQVKVRAEQQSAASKEWPTQLPSFLPFYVPTMADWPVAEAAAQKSDKGDPIWNPIVFFVVPPLDRDREFRTEPAIHLLDRREREIKREREIDR
jgi:hypothetical protein